MCKNRDFLSLVVIFNAKFENGVDILLCELNF